ncbi:MAG: histidine kinase [Actinomycetota bacterium]|nr:histidine kinase [Actinomycetota bacterium]
MLVFFRRRWPMKVTVVTSLLSSVSSLAAGPATLALVSLATRRRWVQIVPIGPLNLATAYVFLMVQPPTDTEPVWLTTTTNVIFISAVTAWGMYIGSRRELIWTLRSRAERAEAEQEMRLGQARTNERAQIAREMHDVLAHRISQISMHAGALAFRQDLAADQMRDSAAVIQEKAHEALTDLRGVLGVLRDDDTGEPLDRPQPTYADLPGLVEEVRESGLHLDYVDRLDLAEPMPDVVGRTLYRIIQEGITNARKHAPGALLTIEVGGSPERGIDFLLSNPIGFGPSTTPGAGLGLIGLSERAQLHGGRLEHRRQGRAFVVTGWIPWAA